MSHTAKRTDTRTQEQGFTLVELSIVLVIIGLIVGGVLVGQNMIKAAEIRATVSQIEKYNSAINTFRSKYGGLPGDFTDAVRFALGTGVADGDGDGLLEDSDGAIVDLTGELSQFWLQLSASNMIDGAYEVYTTGDNDMAVGTHFPASRHGNGGVVAYNSNGFNHFHIGIADSADDTMGFADTLLPEDAFAIDQKLDDGVGTTGSVRGMDGTTLAATGVDGTDCYGAGTDYDLDEAAVICQVRLRMN